MNLRATVAASVVAVCALGATAACGQQHADGAAPTPSTSATPVASTSTMPGPSTSKSDTTVSMDLGPADPTTAYAMAAGGERITSFVVNDRIDAKGVLHVSETIAYDFGTERRHGIYRDLVVRGPNPAAPEKSVTYGISNVHVGAVGASGKLSRSTVTDGSTRELRLKIGDPSRTVTGLHRYTIRYDVTGAIRSVSGNPQLYWDVTGDGWMVPIEGLRVAVSSPGGVSKALCFAGRVGSTMHCVAATGASGATYRRDFLPPGLGLTVVAGLKAGAVSVRSR